MDERHALRIAAFRLARHRGRLSEAAWAAARLRLDGVRLSPAEIRDARALQVRYGRALRLARLGRATTGTPPATSPVIAPPPARTRHRVVCGALIAAALFVVTVLFLDLRPTPFASPEGAAPVAAAALTPPPQLRGRSQSGLAALAPAPVPAPPTATEAPATLPPAPEPAREPAPSGGAGPIAVGTDTGAGGAGSGSAGSGTGADPAGRTVPPTRFPVPATPAPPVTPGPLVTPPPPPPLVAPPDVMHVRGRVVDAVTGRGIPNACIAIGVATCAGAPVTDPGGDFAVDLSIGRVLNWQLTFISAGYQTRSIQLASRVGTVYLASVRLRSAP